MSAPLPQISIVTPCLDAADTIEATLRSVADQRGVEVEHVVLDGGSGDGTQEILRQCEGHLAHWESCPDAGMYDAINRGFSQTGGEILAWLNADDQYTPHALRAVTEIFELFPSVDWISGLPSGRNDAGLIAVVHGGAAYPREFVRRGLACRGEGILYVQQESCFWRRSLWEACGPIPVEFKLAGDFWLWRRFAERADLVSVSCVLAAFTDRKDQLSRRQAERYREETARVIPECPPDRARYRRLLPLGALCARRPTTHRVFRAWVRRRLGSDPFAFRRILRRDGAWRLSNETSCVLRVAHGYRLKGVGSR